MTMTCCQDLCADVFRIDSKTDSLEPILVELRNVFLRDKIIKTVKDYNKTDKNFKFDSANLLLEGAPKLYVIYMYVDENV